MDFYDSDATITEIEDDNTVPVINSKINGYSNNVNSSNSNNNNNNNTFVNRTSLNNINLEAGDIQNDPPLILHFYPAIQQRRQKSHYLSNASEFVAFARTAAIDTSLLLRRQSTRAVLHTLRRQQSIPTPGFRPATFPLYQHDRRNHAVLSTASASTKQLTNSLGQSVPAEQCQLLIEQQQQQESRQQPKLLSIKSKQEDFCKMLPFKGHFINATLVSMGNPHCVVHLENVQDFPMDYYGEVIETHPIFPDKTNVEFVEVISSNQVRARVWQRGCGTTNACGTGACAIVVAGVLRGKTDRKCTVHMDGGSLEVEWRNEDEYVYHSGPSTTTFQGTVRFFLSELH
ncbi:diaminopimelate epimerase [Heterostelium album PN500]|uniref:Diaminopimelate epimerase n=1 Tax=Heterostelium pallidum (strain ATCC 26659 / Pp 5 / PN500) TaxID=670386 RepID=D3BNQ5_HETP5|nr:diaminopimelate epimerase [Heterostelium album PN500]EFA76824.1 diaminopimelate epimerase [Heterostelium album PN500]|eukprot:XP_020428956.1 diaminopimelate epimerase [Heterostelium album PN500]